VYEASGSRLESNNLATVLRSDGHFIFRVKFERITILTEFSEKDISVQERFLYERPSK
jgi:hypothetical protein